MGYLTGGGILLRGQPPCSSPIRGSQDVVVSFRGPLSPATGTRLSTARVSAERRHTGCERFKGRALTRNCHPDELTPARVRVRNEAMSCLLEPSITELLSEPLVQMVMARD